MQNVYMGEGQNNRKEEKSNNQTKPFVDQPFIAKSIQNILNCELHANEKATKRLQN